MDFEYDPSKSARNKADAARRFSFELILEFDWKTALEIPDTRRDYGEERLISLGYIRTRLYVIVWTRRGKNRRIISMRKANIREKRLYEKKANH